MGKVMIGNLPDPPYAIEEAVNRLRINLGFLGKDIRKVMVISTMPDEGKSFVSIQLWRQMALAGIRTVLVDMDLRKSVMAEKYRVRAWNGGRIGGTSGYLSGEVPLVAALCATEFADGYLVPNMDNVVNPSILLEGNLLEEMLTELEKEFRYVLLDCPPLGLVSDGERIGNLCDGAILVVRSGVTPKGLVKHSIQQLERAGCPLLGIVLNRAGGAGDGYYYRKYGGKYYGGKYGDQYYYGKGKQ